MTFRQLQKINNNNVLHVVYIFMEKNDKFHDKILLFQVFLLKIQRNSLKLMSCYGVKISQPTPEQLWDWVFNPECNGVLGFNAFLTSESLLV